MRGYLGRTAGRLLGRLTAVAGLAVLATGCTSSPAEPPTTAPTGPAPAVEFEASIQRQGESLEVTYRVVNAEADRDLYALNRVFPEDDPFLVEARPDGVYVTGRDRDTVELSKRAFDMPPGVLYDAPAMLGATRFGPGEVVEESFTVPLPLQRRHPYGNEVREGTVTLPDPIRFVVFCLGVVSIEPETSPEAPGELIFDHFSSVTGAQHVFCSQPVAFD